MLPKTNVELLAYAKRILENTSSDKFQVDEAYRYLRAIPRSAKEYNEAQKMLADFNKQQTSIRKQNENEAQEFQKKKEETKKIAIGMSYEEVEELCGKPDRSSSLESVRGTIWTSEYKFSDQHRKFSCWGTFTFIDYKLDSIYRGE